MCVNCDTDRGICKNTGRLCTKNCGAISFTELDFDIFLHTLTRKANTFQVVCEEALLIAKEKDILDRKKFET